MELTNDELLYLAVLTDPASAHVVLAMLGSHNFTAAGYAALAKLHGELCDIADVHTEREIDPAPSVCTEDTINERADIHNGAVETRRNGVERGLCLDCGSSWEV